MGNFCNSVNNNSNKEERRESLARPAPVHLLTPDLTGSFSQQIKMTMFAQAGWVPKAAASCSQGQMGMFW